MAGGARAREGGAGDVSTARRWGECLVAILIGNIIYLFIEPQLPTVMRHQLFRVDLGSAVDFLICAVIYALVRVVRKPASGS